MNGDHEPRRRGTPAATKADVDARRAHDAEAPGARAQHHPRHARADHSSLRRRRLIVDASLAARGLTRRPVDLEEVRRRRDRGESWRAIARAMKIPASTIRGDWRAASGKDPQRFRPFRPGLLSAYIDLSLKA